MTDLDLLALDAATCFILDEAGRMRGVNSPEGLVPPRLYLAGCQVGNIVRCRQDVPADSARSIESLVATEPPLQDPDGDPLHLPEYLRILGPVGRVEHGLTWVIPPGLSYEHPAPFIRSGTAEGESLLARWDVEGMPAALVALGFVDTGEFWPPWCVALEDGEVASIAFAARLGPHAAEAGVATVPAFRGRGFAAAATAGWASHPALREHTLFYSTSRENRSSQRVVERLNLRFLGPTLSVY